MASREARSFASGIGSLKRTVAWRVPRGVGYLPRRTSSSNLSSDSFDRRHLGHVVAGVAVELDREEQVFHVSFELLTSRVIEFGASRGRATLLRSR